jgi:hypothetical protein
MDSDRREAVQPLCGQTSGVPSAWYSPPNPDRLVYSLWASSGERAILVVVVVAVEPVASAADRMERPVLETSVQENTVEALVAAVGENPVIDYLCGENHWENEMHCHCFGVKYCRFAGDSKSYYS